MTEKIFAKYNLIAGWGVFVIALITYCLTVEPTVSFWDCGEYIATSAKLEVGHPPGAPFFQMMGAVLSAFAPNADKVALLVDRKSTRLNSSHQTISYAVFCLKKKIFTCPR